MYYDTIWYDLTQFLSMSRLRSVGNSTASFLLAGICVRANPFNFRMPRLQNLRLWTVLLAPHESHGRSEAVLSGETKLSKVSRHNQSILWGIDCSKLSEARWQPCFRAGWFSNLFRAPLTPPVRALCEYLGKSWNLIAKRTPGGFWRSRADSVQLQTLLWYTPWFLVFLFYIPLLREQSPRSYFTGSFLQCD